MKWVLVRLGSVKTRPSVFDRVKLEAIKVERLISLVVFRFFVTVSSVAFNDGYETQFLWLAQAKKNNHAASRGMVV